MGALAQAEKDETARILKDTRVAPDSLVPAIDGLQKGRKLECAIAGAGYDALGKYTRYLTQVARDGKIDPIIGRDEEMRRTIQVLSHRTKNNPVLIGEPGVGARSLLPGRRR